jgi:hypothetical protein
MTYRGHEIHVESFTIGSGAGAIVKKRYSAQIGTLKLKANSEEEIRARIDRAIDDPQ